MTDRLVYLAAMLLAASVIAWGVRAGVRTSAARERARTAEDSIATLLPALEALEDQAIAGAALAAARSDSLNAERALHETERAETERAVRAARALGTAALDSARAEASEQVGIYLDTHEAEDSVAFAGYEAQLQSLALDLSSALMQAEEAARLAELNGAGWDAERALRIQEALRADAWQRAANPPLARRLVASLPFFSTQGTFAFALGLAAGIMVTS